MEPVAANDLISSLLSTGPLGVVIVGMGYWIIRLQRKLDEVQEKRVENALQFASVANELGAAVERNTEFLRQERDR